MIEIVIKFSFRWLGIGDYSLCFVGFTSFMCGLLFLGFSQTDLMVYMSAVIGFGSKLADAVLRALISQVRGSISSLFTYYF